MSQRETRSSKRKTRSQSVPAASTQPPRKVPRKTNAKKKQKPRKQTISPPSRAQATILSSSNRNASESNAKKKQKPRKQTVSPPSSTQAASNRNASESNAKKKQRKKQAIQPPPSAPITITVYPPSSPSSRDASKLKASCLLDYYGVQDAKVVQSHQGQLLKTSFPVENKTFELAVVQVHDEYYFFATMHRTNGFPEFSLDGPCTLLEAEDAFIKMLLRKANTTWPPSSPTSSASRSQQATRQLRQGFFVPQPTDPPHILNGRAVEFRMD